MPEDCSKKLLEFSGGFPFVWHIGLVSESISDVISVGTNGAFCDAFHTAALSFDDVIVAGVILEASLTDVTMLSSCGAMLASPSSSRGVVSDVIFVTSSRSVTSRNVDVTLSTQVDRWR